MLTIRKSITAVSFGMALFGLVSTVGYAAGLKVCTEAHYKGTCEELGADVSNLGKIKGPCNGSWNDCISSIDVAEGVSVKVCNDADFKGECSVLKDDAMDLSTVKGPCNGTWNDCVSSIDIQ